MDSSLRENGTYNPRHTDLITWAKNVNEMRDAVRDAETLENVISGN